MTKKEFEKLCHTPANNTSEGTPNWTFWQWMQQDDREFWLLVEEVSKINPKRILEVGSAHGAGLIFYDRMVGPDGQVVSINYSDGGTHQWTMDYSTCTSDMTFINQNSHDPAALEAVTAALTGPIDFLFIDGDHSYEGVKMDYEMYSPLVRAGGLVGFHDISYDSEIQVGKFFKTIDCPTRKIEFSHGIGIVFL